MKDRRSKLAQDLQRLQSSVSQVIERREVLPQPLFWSLFHSKIEKIRALKQKDRLMKAVLYNPRLFED